MRDARAAWRAGAPQRRRGPPVQAPDEAVLRARSARGDATRGAREAAKMVCTLTMTWMLRCVVALGKNYSHRD